MRMHRMTATGLMSLFPFAWALADRPAPPRDYKVVTESEKYVFVMMVPENARFNQSSDIRKQYSESGLYQNDGSELKRSVISSGWPIVTTMMSGAS